MTRLILSPVKEEQLPPFGKELSTWYVLFVISLFVILVFFDFGYEARILVLIIRVLDHCLRFIYIKIESTSLFYSEIK